MLSLLTFRLNVWINQGFVSELQLKIVLYFSCRFLDVLSCFCSNYRLLLTSTLRLLERNRGNVNEVEGDTIREESKVECMRGW